jgi:hypothetical protein
LTRYATLTYITPKFYDAVIYENRSIFAHVAPRSERLLLSWFHVRSATFSPHEDVVYRSMMCTWDEQCRESQVLKLDQLFLEHSVSYAREISSLKKRILSKPPVWDLDLAHDIDDFQDAGLPSAGALERRVARIAQANRAIFDSHAAVFKNLISRIRNSNTTSEGAMEQNLESHFIYHSIMSFNCFVMPFIVGICMKCAQLVTGVNVMKRDGVRHFFIAFCLFSWFSVLFESKLTIVLPYYVTQTCSQLHSALVRLQSTHGLYETSDFFEKSLKDCPLKTASYENLHQEAAGFGSPPFALQLHRLFTSSMHNLRRYLGFWDNSNIPTSLFVGFQLFYYRHQKIFGSLLERIKSWTYYAAFGAAQTKADDPLSP